MMITLLDGGMGQELVARAGRATGLWSTQALLDNPQLVRDVHDDYFAAGAEVATTDSYSVLPDRLEPVGLLDKLPQLMALSCEIAVTARDANGFGTVAGSLGPIGFSYQPDKAPPPDEAAEIYGQMAQLQAPFVDCHILETMSSVDQAKGGLMGAGVTGKPIWLALSVDDQDGTKLRSGEPIGDIAPLLEQYSPQVVLLNCSVPEAIDAGLPSLARLGVPFGAYANGFTGIAKDFNKVGATVDLLESRMDLGPKPYADFAAGWVELGATYIGGCCEVGPAHIAELHTRFKGAA
ncbi:homocysteine S-methyltransferase family protein [Algirhabdus cladophorae]|uniref:homocysteine S-methyltransferase family protein n=1 Tax=Algirhabdus cladophorae TaxID=3377108 RepID=UPI003B846CD7